MASLPRSKKAGGMARYTAMFLLCMAFYMGMMAAHGKLPMFRVDGYMQHFTVLGYVSRTVRGLLAGEGFKMVNFSLGQGMDTLTTLSYYGYTDVLNLPAALFGQDGMVYAYLLIDALRAYLAGACLIGYARRLGAGSGWALSCAGILYVFSGYGIYNLAWHTYFLNAAMYLPLMLLCVEDILAERGWIGLTLVTALMLLANFYFAYMNTLIAVVYIALRLIARARTRGLRGTARDGFTLLGSYLLGAALSAVVFVPVVIAFLRNARLGVTTGYSGSMLRYPNRYYSGMFINMFTVRGMVGNWTILNYAPLALFGGACLLFRRGRRAWVPRIGLLLSLLALSVPMVGRIMNGGAYVNNRWCYVLGMFLAAGCALALPDLFRRDRRAIRRVAAACAGIYCGGTLALMLRGGSFRLICLPDIALLLGFAAFLLLYDSPALAAMRRVSAQRVAGAFLVVSVMMNMFCLYRSIGLYTELMPWDLNEAYANETVADQLDTGGAYRVDQQRYRDPHAMLKDYLGAGFYWSMVDSTLGNYYSHLGLATQPYLDCVIDLGGGASMAAVSATKYSVLSEEDSDLIPPYGFTLTGTMASPNGSAFRVYENDHALPLGIAFDAALSTEEYNALPVENRLQALTAFAVCDGDAVPKAGGMPTSETVPFAVESVQGVEIDGNTLKAGEGGTLKLSFETLPDAETWLIADNLNTSADASFEIRTTRGRAEGCRVAADNKFYFDRPATAVCLGGGDDVLRGCEIAFTEAAEYRFDSFRVVCLPMERYREDTAARKAEAMEDVALGVNRLSGRVTVGGDRVLQIAVPYSSGWTAKVDGAPVEVFRCGGMYMGVALAEGEHEIEMRYVTPGLKPGAAVSLAALALLIVLAVLSARRRASRRGK